MFSMDTKRELYLINISTWCPMQENDVILRMRTDGTTYDTLELDRFVMVTSLDYSDVSDVYVCYMTAGWSREGRCIKVMEANTWRTSASISLNHTRGSRRVRVHKTGGKETIYFSGHDRIFLFDLQCRPQGTYRTYSPLAGGMRGLGDPSEVCTYTETGVLVVSRRQGCLVTLWRDIGEKQGRELRWFGNTRIRQTRELTVNNTGCKPMY